MKYKIASLCLLLSIHIPTAFSHGGPGNMEKPIKRTTVIGNERTENGIDENEIAGKLIQKKIIDGFDFKLKVVDVRDSVSDGGSHNLLVNIKYSGRVQKKLSVTAKVDHLNGVTKSKSMLELGDWYLAGFNLDHKEKYRITVLFKSRDGTDHKSIINYP